MMIKYVYKFCSGVKIYHRDLYKKPQLDELLLAECE